MSKFNPALSEINSLEDLSKRRNLVNSLHPLFKLIVTLFYLIMTVSFNKYDFVGLIGFIFYPVIMFELADLSFADAFKRLKYIMPLVIITGIFNPFFDRSSFYHAGSFIITGGMVSFITLLIKGLFTLLGGYILIATTSISDICAALRMLHIPKIIVTVIMLIYRYIVLLVTETDTMSKAYILRANRQKGIQFSLWGSFAGNLLLRSIDRAEEVYQGMLLRGFDGEFRTGKKYSVTGLDFTFALIILALIIVFRLFTVLSFIGGLII